MVGRPAAVITAPRAAAVAALLPVGVEAEIYFGPGLLGRRGGCWRGRRARRGATRRRGARGRCGCREGGDASTDSGADADVNQPPAYQYAKYDLNHLIVVGQSNALGIGTGVALSTVPHGAPACAAATPEACSAVMFSTGVFPSTSCQRDERGCAMAEARTSLLPLVEGDNYGSREGPTLWKRLAVASPTRRPLSRRADTSRVYLC